MSARIVLLTALAMVAFAANSLLSRLALGAGEIDPASFGAVRMASGAAMLALLLAFNRKPVLALRPHWASAGALLVYMVFFTFAYVWLGAAVGALILFGSVQLTMFAAAIRNGERFAPAVWGGLSLAAGGLVYLVSPGLTAPDPAGAIMMAIAGLAWGVYSLLGRRAADPLSATASNFVFATPLACVPLLFMLNALETSPTGLTLAIASGALASACGYVIWYAALPHLSAARAAMVQLSVPVIAAIGAVMFLAEPATQRLIVASAVTIGGIALAISQRARRAG